MSVSAKVSARFFVFSTILSTLVLTSGNVVSAGELQKGNLLENPLVATIATAAARPRDGHDAYIKLKMRSDRNSIYLKNQSEIRLAKYQQTKSAPLVFVISGAGGTGVSGTSKIIAEKFYQSGFNVISLPNPNSWNYAAGYSQSGVPGYVLSDALEYYQFLKDVSQTLKNRYHMKISGYHLVGYSLGGFLAGHLAKIDISKKDFSFEKVIMINPPTDLTYSIAVLDSFYTDGSDFGPRTRLRILSIATSLGISLYKKGFNQDSLEQTLAGLDFTEKELKWLIGASFRASLGDLIYVAEEVSQLGVLKTPQSPRKRSARYEEARSFSFADYLESILMPSLTKSKTPATLDEVYAQSKLYPLMDFFAQHENIYAIHSADDFLMPKNDFEILQNTFGPRMTLYPKGGHLGNLWQPDVLNHLVSILK